MKVHEETVLKKVTQVATKTKMPHTEKKKITISTCEYEGSCGLFGLKAKETQLLIGK